MNKRFLITTLIILTSFLFLTSKISAEIVGGVELSYGLANHKYLGKEIERTTQWSSGLWANLIYEDLLFTSVYQRNIALGLSKIESDLLQLTANYRFYDEEFMNIYGGLGYKLLNTKVKHPELDDNLFYLTGHGVVGQVIINILITDQLHATSRITGNPWQNWFFSQDGEATSNIEKAPAFTYELALCYSLIGDFSLNLGLSGGSNKVPSFKDKGESRNSHSGIKLSINRKF